MAHDPETDRPSGACACLLVLACGPHAGHWQAPPFWVLMRVVRGSRAISFEFGVRLAGCVVGGRGWSWVVVGGCVRGCVGVRVAVLYRRMEVGNEASFSLSYHT